MTDEKLVVPHVVGGHPGDNDVLILTPQEAPVIQKNEVMEFLRKELTEENTDKVIHLLTEEAKRRTPVPGIAVDAAGKVFDWLLPEHLLNAIEKALD